MLLAQIFFYFLACNWVIAKRWKKCPRLSASVCGKIINAVSFELVAALYLKPYTINRIPYTVYRKPYSGFIPYTVYL